MSIGQKPAVGAGSVLQFFWVSEFAHLNSGSYGGIIDLEDQVDSFEADTSKMLEPRKNFDDPLTEPNLIPPTLHFESVYGVQISNPIIIKGSPIDQLLHMKMP